MNTTPAYIEALVAHLNTTDDLFYFEGRYITQRQVNIDGAALVASGAVIEIPGDPYTWAVAEQANA